MNISTVSTVIAIAAAVGYFFGLLVGRSSQRRQKNQETPHPVPLPEVEQPEEREALPPTSAPVIEQPEEQDVPDETTVLRVIVDLTQKWCLELDGARLEDPALLTPEQRQRIVSTVVQIRPWIDGKPAQAPAAAPAPAPVQPTPPTPVLQPSPVVASPAPSALEQPVQTPNPVPVTPPALKPITALPAAQKPVEAPAPVRIDPMRGFRTMLKNEFQKPEEVKAPSIVGMIDSVLQAKIVDTQFAGKGIRLEEGSLGEVVVYVGASRYPGIDAVPDPEVQALIRSAIADWEKK